MLIVVINTVGPTMAKKALTAKAFRTSFKNSIVIAADNSINADKIRNPAIDMTVESMSSSQRLNLFPPIPDPVKTYH